MLMTDSFVSYRVKPYQRENLGKCSKVRWRARSTWYSSYCSLAENTETRISVYGKLKIYQHFISFKSLHQIWPLAYLCVYRYTSEYQSWLFSFRYLLSGEFKRMSKEIYLCTYFTKPIRYHYLMKLCNLKWSKSNPTL